MIRNIFLLIILLLGSAWLGTILAEDQGLVTIIWQKTSIQTSLAVAIIFLLIVLLVVWQLAKLFLRIDLLIKNYKDKKNNKKQINFAKKFAEQTACEELLNAMHAAAHLPTLNTIWQKLPRRLQKNSRVIACYTECLAHYSDQAENILKLLLKKLNKKPDQLLLSQFVKFKISTTEKKLYLVEKWLKKQPKEFSLLLAAGQLCLQCQLWGKARIYLNQCLNQKATPEVLEGLGKLAEEVSDTQTAMQRYREGLQLIHARVNH